MDVSKMPNYKRQLRMNVRNFLLLATEIELKKELELSMDREDLFRAECVQEIINERRTESC